MITVGQLNTVSGVCFALSLLVRLARRYRPCVPYRVTGGTLTVGPSITTGSIIIARGMR